MMNTTSLRPKNAALFLGISLATFWRYAKRAGFPKPRHLSSRCTVFDLQELTAWRDKQTPYHTGAINHD